MAVDPMTNPEIYPLQPPHVFDVVTSSMTYYVGVDMSNAHSQDLKPQSEVEGQFKYREVKSQLHIELLVCPQKGSHGFIG